MVEWSSEVERHAQRVTGQRDLTILDRLRQTRTATEAGPAAATILRLIRPDHAPLGVGGVFATGDLRDTTIAQDPSEQAMATARDAVTVLAGHSDFPGTGTARVALPSSLVGVITDAEPPVTATAAIAARSVEVLVV